MAEHKSLPDAELHEPKGASTASSGMVYIADGLGSGSWVRPTGWETKSDSVYNSSSKLAIAADEKTRIQIDGVAFSDGEGLDVWDSSVNKLVTEGERYCYDIRISFKCTATTAGIVDLSYEAGGTVFLTKTLSIAKGASVTNQIVGAMPMYTGATVVANGGVEFYVTPSENISAWDFQIFIIRTHVAF
jgi:hypothetical protein